MYTRCSSMMQFSGEQRQWTGHYLLRDAVSIPQLFYSHTWKFQSHCVTYISQDYATKIKQNSVSCTLELRLRTKVNCSLLHKVEEYKIKYSLSEVFKMLHLLCLVMLSQKFHFYSFALHRSIVCILQMFLQDVALTLVVLEYLHFSVFISIDLD